MESAFTYIGNLVEVFEDVGKGNGAKRSNETVESNDTILACHEIGLPNCNLELTNSAEDYPYYEEEDSEDMDLIDLELQKQHERLASFEDEDKLSDMSDHSRSNRHSRRKSQRAMRSVPSQESDNKRSFSSLLKTGIQDNAGRLIAGRMPSLRSIRDPPDLAKSRSSLGSNNTKETDDDDVENDCSDFSWEDDLSSNDGDNTKKRRKHTKGYRNYLPPPPKSRNLEWFAHGRMWTCIAIAFGWLGFGFAYMARESTEFVLLKEPMYLDPRYETIPTAGMIRLELCLNETHLDILDDLNGGAVLLEPGEEPDIKPRPRTVDNAVVRGHQADKFGPSVVDTATTPCILHKVNSDDVHDDINYEVSRSVAFLALAVGIFSTICLTFAIYWKTINLRPIGAGYLIAYFLQSFTFLVFDSNLCRDHGGCAMGQGGIYSALASACWILACAASARMDKRKYRNQEKQMELAVQEATSPGLYKMRPKHIMIEKQLHRNAVVDQVMKEYMDDEEKEKQIEKQRAAISAEYLEKQVIRNTSQAPRIKKYLKEQEQRERMNAADERRMNNSNAVHTESRNVYAPPVNPNQQIVAEPTANPIYIPTLPEPKMNPVYLPVLPAESPPTSSTSLKKKSKKPRSTSSVAKEESSATLEIEETKESRPKKPKSKKKIKADDETEQSKKPRSKKSKPKSERKSTREIEEHGLIQSQSSFASTGTKEERKKKPKSSKKKKSDVEKQPSIILNEELLEGRPRSSRKSKRDVDSVSSRKSKRDASVSSRKSKRDADSVNGKKKKKSTRRSSRRLDGTSPDSEISLSIDSSSSPEERQIKTSAKKAEEDPTAVKKRSSSRPRKGKREENSRRAVVKDSLRKVIDDSDTFEL